MHLCRILVASLALCLSLSGIAHGQRFNEPILQAAEQGDLKRVGELLEKDPLAVHTLGQFKTSPLHLAAERGHVEIVKLLLAKGARTDVVSTIGGTPLLVAIKHKQLAVVRLLLDAGAVPQSSELVWAASQGNPELVEALLAKNAPIDGWGFTKQTPLMAAARSGKIEVVRILVERGAKLDLVGEERTALQCALADGNAEIAEYLALRNAGPRAALGLPLLVDADLQDHAKVRARVAAIVAAITDFCPACLAGKTEKVREYLALQPKLATFGRFPRAQDAISCAVEGGKLEILKLLDENGANVTERESQRGGAIAIALYKGNEPMVRYLVARGVAVNGEDKLRYRPLLLLPANANNLKMAQLLIELGADVNQIASPGTTALETAVERGHVPMINFLLERGAKVNLREGQRTPLHIAAAQGNREVVALLLRHGADVAAKDRSGQTALQVAAQSGKREIVDLLAGKGESLDIASLVTLGDLKKVETLLDEQPALLSTKDLNDNSLLHLAVEHDRRDLTRLLLARGADVNVGNKEGSTPLHVAVAKQRRDLAKMLLDAKADPTIRNRYGETPADRSRSRLSMLELFSPPSPITAPTSAAPGVRIVGTVSSKSVPAGETVRGQVGRPPEFDLPSVVVGKWKIYPGGKYRFESNSLDLTVGNANGKAYIEARFAEGRKRYIIVIDESAVPQIKRTVSEPSYSSQRELKDRDEFRVMERELCESLETLLDKHAHDQIEGHFEILGPAEPIVVAKSATSPVPAVAKPDAPTPAAATPQTPATSQPANEPRRGIFRWLVPRSRR